MTAGWKPGQRHSDDACYRMGALKLGIEPCEYRAKREAGLRWCSGCHGWEPVERFGPHIRMRDGLNTRCVESAREYAREYQRRKRAR